MLPCTSSTSPTHPRVHSRRFMASCVVQFVLRSPAAVPCQLHKVVTQYSTASNLQLWLPAATMTQAQQRDLFQTMCTPDQVLIAYLSWGQMPRASPRALSDVTCTIFMSCRVLSEFSICVRICLQIKVISLSIPRIHSDHAGIFARQDSWSYLRTLAALFLQKAPSSDLQTAF